MGIDSLSKPFAGGQNGQPALRSQWEGVFSLRLPEAREMKKRRALEKSAPGSTELLFARNAYLVKGPALLVPSTQPLPSEVV